jgi:hypothetical protein
MTLQRIVIDLRSEELILRVLYKSTGDSNPGTVCRRREVEDLCRSGLRQALAALEGGADVVGVSGYTVREDILSLPRPGEAREPLPLLRAANARSPSEKGA